MKNKIILCLFSGAVFSSDVTAVQPEAYTTDSGIAITPIINTGYKYNNNIFSQSSNTTGSGIYTLAPAASFLLDDGINNYKFDLGGESGTYVDSSDDDYLTGYIGFKTHLEAGSRNRFDVALKLDSQVEPRGTGITEGLGDIVDAPIQYTGQFGQLIYGYGSLASSARIDFLGSYYSKRYTNFTEYTEYRSYDESTLGSTLFYTTNANTDAFFRIKGSTIRYDKNQLVSRDSDVYFVLLGVKWEATALTSGSFEIGQEQKKFVDSNREDFKGVSWEGHVDWKPLTYTALSLVTSRAAKDPDGRGDYIIESIYGASWKHEWNEKVTTNMNYSFINDDYSGYLDTDYSGNGRDDKTNNIYVDVIYELQRWVDVTLFVEYTDNDSTDEIMIYDTSIVGLDFTFSL
ncbi:outer membrane beta-barrel protein [Colwellia echini]|uniref:Outer membrane beta-barrel protein n=1 Tax=Colwellia echini TaxID=1982103 RepID=A0ABY3MUH8_9GAMM|nr:outer membrane beta-barrel protein [Colwellia echini]TYK64781.1 outer membrane beta-barrel protein [Colwellia echini]